MSGKLRIYRRWVPRVATYAIAVIGAFAPAQAQETGLPQTSLFFTPQEAHEAETLAQRLAPAGRGDIHCGAIFYYGPKDWTVWLQGKKWTPETSRDDLQILEVTASDVRLLWHGEDGASPVAFSLKPNQSFQIATRKVIAGP